MQAAELKTSTIDTPKASDSAKLKQARQNVTDAKTKQEKNRKNKNESSLFATYMNTKVSSSKTDKAGNTVKTYKKHSAGDSLNRIAMRQKAKKAISATFQASSMTDGPEKTQALKDAGTLTKQLDENGGLSAENTKLQKEVQSLYKKGDKRSDEEKEKKPSQIDKASNKLTQASQSYAGQLAGRMEFAVSGSWGILDKILQDLKERREKKEEKKLIEKLSRMDMDADDFKEKNPNVSDNVIAKAKKKQAIRKVRQDSNSERKIMKAKRKADRQSKKNKESKIEKNNEKKKDENNKDTDKIEGDHSDKLLKDWPDDLWYRRVTRGVPNTPMAPWGMIFGHLYLWKAEAYARTFHDPLDKRTAKRPVPPVPTKEEIESWKTKELFLDPLL